MSRTSLLVIALSALGGCATPDAALPIQDQGSQSPADLAGGAVDLAQQGPRDGGANDLAGHASDLAGHSTDLAGGGSTDMARVNTGHAIKTVFIIIMENANWSTIKGSTHAPYINNTLLPSAAHAEAYNNIPGLHPSEPNYLWLEAGTNFGITADGLPAADHQPSTAAHLVTQLEAAGITWKSYQEDIDGTTCPLTAVKEYAPKHDPMVYFDDVTNTNDTASARCLAHVRPYAELANDLTNGTVAQYNFITPNLCHDGHGSDPLAADFACLPIITDLVKLGDTWLSTEVPMIQQANAYKNGGAIFVTWDESEGADVPIGMIVASPLAKTAAGGYSNSIAYTHSSTLKSMQEIFGVTPLLGGAADPATTDLADLFTSFP